MTTMSDPGCAPVEMIASACENNCRYPQKTIQLDPTTRAGASCIMRKKQLPANEIPLFINNLTAPAEV